MSTFQKITKSSDMNTPKCDSGLGEGLLGYILANFPGENYSGSFRFSSLGLNMVFLTFYRQEYNVFPSRTLRKFRTFILKFDRSVCLLFWFFVTFLLFFRSRWGYYPTSEWKSQSNDKQELPAILWITAQGRSEMVRLTSLQSPSPILFKLRNRPLMFQEKKRTIFMLCSLDRKWQRCHFRSSVDPGSSGYHHKAESDWQKKIPRKITAQELSISKAQRQSHFRTTQAYTNCRVVAVREN